MDKVMMVAVLLICYLPFTHDGFRIMRIVRFIWSIYLTFLIVR